MASPLAVTFTGLRFPNPFLLSSAPPTESDSNIMRAFDAGWGGVVTKTIGLHPVVNVRGPKTKFLRATPDAPHLSMQKRAGTALHSSWNWELISDKPLDWWVPRIAKIKNFRPPSASSNSSPPAPISAARSLRLPLFPPTASRRCGGVRYAGEGSGIPQGRRTRQGADRPDLRRTAAARPDHAVQGAEGYRRARQGRDGLRAVRRPGRPLRERAPRKDVRPQVQLSGPRLRVSDVRGSSPARGEGTAIRASPRHDTHASSFSRGIDPPSFANLPRINEGSGAPTGARVHRHPFVSGPVT